MSSIAENISEVKKEIKQALLKAGRGEEDAKLVAVSKTFPAEAILEALAAGQELFGENYIQDAVEKIPLIREKHESAKFHFIGHLQRNKSKLAVQNFDVIETIDSIRLAEAIANECEKQSKKIEVLAQVNISGEASKSGVSKEDLAALIDLMLASEFLDLKGLLSIGSFGESNIEEFRQMAQLLDSERQRSGLELSELSMGMSSDFQDAILSGATLVRVGTRIFGAREKR